jgi:hypothetical protein
MPAYTGTTILNVGQPGISVPVLNPILTVPPGMQFNLVGFQFTNSSAVVQTISVFRDSLSSAPLFTVAVGAGASVLQASTQVLSPGETLYAVPAAVSGYYSITTEIDGYIAML